MSTISLAEVNAMSIAAFTEAFADIAEKAPWVATASAAVRPFADREAMIAAFAEAIDMAEDGEKLDLLCNHPDLAGRAALAGTMTRHSAEEQRGAGLDRLTTPEISALTHLNTQYSEKFGFPFILAVKGARLETIMQALERRLSDERPRELKTALDEVKRIVRFRIEARVR